MSKYNENDLSVLRFLDQWDVSRKQMNRLVRESSLTPDALLESLQKLESNKLISVTGPQTLADFAKLVAKAGSFDNPPPAGTDARAAFNNAVFWDKDTRTDYAFVEVDLTWRGKLKMAFDLGPPAKDGKEPVRWEPPPPC